MPQPGPLLSQRLSFATLSGVTASVFKCPLASFSKQKPAYEIKECDWSSDVCSSDLLGSDDAERGTAGARAACGSPQPGCVRQWRTGARRLASTPRSRQSDHRSLTDIRGLPRSECGRLLCARGRCRGVK